MYYKKERKESQSIGMTKIKIFDFTQTKAILIINTFIKQKQMNYLNRQELESKSLVANNSMNRKRKAFGTNSYNKELKIDIWGYLLKCLNEKQEFYWLDICCGEGNALIQIAGNLVKKEFNTEQIRLIGVDLVPFFSHKAQDFSFLQFIESSIFDYKTNLKFDLITCVHGMHYLGDKLQFIEITSQLLKTDGNFIANLDIHDMVDDRGNCANRQIDSFFKKTGLKYHSKNKILINPGIQSIESPFRYLGASENGIVNYTGQETVESIYLI